MHDILIRDVTIKNSLYAARYKCAVSCHVTMNYNSLHRGSTGDAGTARNITYENVWLQNCTFPIYVTQK